MHRLHRAAGIAAATLLGAIGALHALWAVGSSWPAADRRRLAAAVAGTTQMPSHAASAKVSAALFGASALTAGTGGTAPAARLARDTTAAVLAVRGAAGVTGRTDLLLSWTPTEPFRSYDRRFHGPLCLLIAALLTLSRRAGAGSRRGAVADAQIPPGTDANAMTHEPHGWRAVWAQRSGTVGTR